MNIFVLDKDPTIAAQFHCDKHVVKMILESAQLLSTAHRVLDGKQGIKLSKSGAKLKMWTLEEPLESILYQATHYNHPCAVWVRQGFVNYRWLYLHFLALCEEYTFRYGKKHLTETKLRDILDQEPIKIPSGQTEFVTAMTNLYPQCVVPNDPVASYRNYYNVKDGLIDMKWTKRDAPEWFQQNT